MRDMVKAPRSVGYCLVLALILTLVAACGGSDSGNAGDAQPAAESGAGAGEDAGGATEAEGEPGGDTIKVGVLASLSGKYVAFGKPIALGAEKAAQEINDAGGVQVGDRKYQIELVSEDYRSDINTAVSATTGLIRDDGVDFIIGPALSSVGLATQQVSQPLEVVQFGLGTALEAGGALSPELAGQDGDAHWLFQIQASDAIREAVVAEWTKKATEEYLGKPVQSVAILISNDEAGAAVAKVLQTSLQDIGYEVFEPIFYELGTTDFSPYLTRIKNLNPDVLQLWYNVPDVLAALGQAVELDVAPVYFTANLEPRDIEERVGSIEQPILTFCSPLCASVTTSDESKLYFDELSQQSGEELDLAGISIVSYEGLKLLAQAWEAAGTFTDTTAIADHLESHTLDAGLLGDVDFTSSHVLAHGFDVCLVVEGEAQCEFMPPPARSGS